MNVDLQCGIIMDSGRFSLAPLHEFQSSIGVLHYGSTTFHKIPRVDICKSVYILNFSMMYMPTNDTIQALIFKRTNDALFIVGNKLNHILDFELDKSSKGKV
jgi:hypothetical protein